MKATSIRRTGGAGWWVLAVIAVVSVTMIVGSVVWRQQAHRSEGMRLVKEFLYDLDRGDIRKAADLTSYPSAANETLTQVFGGLEPGKADYSLVQYADLNKGTGMFTLSAAWNFGPGKDWNYTAQGNVRKLSVGWRISWEPSTIVPSLDGRTVHLVRTDAAPPRVLDATGNVLMAEQTLDVVRLDPAKTADLGASAAAVAAAIEPVAPLVTQASLLQDVAAAQGKPITAVLLRDDDFAILEPRLAPIPGVVLDKQPKLISTDRRIGSPMLDALRNAWQIQRDATAGWAVQLADQGRAPQWQLAGFQGPPGPDLRSTLDPRLQLAALDAVVSVATKASIVAIQPSTGAVLAVAQNSYANEAGPIAFTKPYPAGRLADLAAGTSVAQLGLVDWKIPGLDAVVSRDFTRNGSTIQEIAAGKATPTATPFGMAIAAASIVRGGAVAPMLVAGQPATAPSAPTGPQALQPDVAERLRALTREPSPETAVLRGYPDIAGIPIVAGDDRAFIGSKGDLAFAVYIEDADGDDQAAKMTDRMFTALAKQ